MEGDGEGLRRKVNDGGRGMGEAVLVGMRLRMGDVRFFRNSGGNKDE